MPTINVIVHYQNCIYSTDIILFLHVILFIDEIKIFSQNVIVYCHIAGCVSLSNL